MLQFPAITELKEAHHGHGSAAGLETLAGSQHALLSHPSSMDNFPTGLYGKEMQEAALVHQRPSLSSAVVASETQAMSETLLCLEGVEVLLSISPTPHGRDCSVYPLQAMRQGAPGFA